MKHPPTLEQLDLDKALTLLQAGVNYLEHNEKDWVTTPSPEPEEAMTIGPGKFGRTRGYIGLGVELFVNLECSSRSEMERTPTPPNWDRIGVGLHIYAEDGRRTRVAILPYNRATGCLGLGVTAQRGLIASLLTSTLFADPGKPL